MVKEEFTDEEESQAWKERETNLFETKLERRRRIRRLERLNDMKQFFLGQPFNIPIQARYLYWDARNSFIHGQFYASINTIASTIEQTIAGRIDPELFRDILPWRLSLKKLIELAFEGEYFSYDLRFDLHEFRVIRNNVIHPKTLMGNKVYASQVTHFSGTSEKTRSTGWGMDSFLIDLIKNKPDSSKIDIEKLEGLTGISVEEAAFRGIELFFQVRNLLI